MIHSICRNLLSPGHSRSIPAKGLSYRMYYKMIQDSQESIFLPFLPYQFPDYTLQDMPDYRSLSEDMGDLQVPIHFQKALLYLHSICSNGYHKWHLCMQALLQKFLRLP